MSENQVSENNFAIEKPSLVALAKPAVDNLEVFAFPATPQQQQLWFLDQLDPGNPAYNIPLAYELHGDLHADALDQSLRWVVNRHETFRTVFAIRGEEFTQIVRSELQIGFHRLDLRNVPEEEKNAACRREVADAAAFRFDLAKGPLVRGALLLLERRRHVVIFNFHHIILDHLSVLQFAREFCRAYSCFRKGQVPAIEAPSLQYPDFAVWQDEQFQEPHFRAELQEWVRGFDANNPPSTFPADRSRPMVQTFAGGEVKFSLPPDLSAGIREFAKTSKKSVYVTLLAVFKCLLARYSGQDDVVVGSPFSNRMVSDLEGVMGCCMNTLPLRSQLGSAETFREALEIVHRTVLAAYSRQRVPLKLIVDAVKPARDTGMNPLFQSTFMLQDPPMKIDLEGLAVTPLCIHNDTSKFDMAIWMWGSEAVFSGLWEYNRRLYDADTIDRLIRNFQTLAAAAVAAPDAPWRRLGFVAPEELRLMNHHFNRTERSWPDNFSLVELVEAAAAERPEAVALVFNGKELTYRELIQRAEALSRQLAKAGVGAESLVGICVDRSPDMVIAMLAILRSGGAYLPLDLSFPTDRLSFMIEDSALGIIVTNSRAAGQLPPHHARTILVDEVPAGELSNGKLAVHLAPDSLAYVRYTSGSTGRPKGVAIPHRALLNFLLSMREQPGCTNRDVLLAVTTLSFDISELEIWLPLLCGGRIVLAAQDQVADGTELLRLIRQHKVTVMQATPATWRLLIDAGWSRDDRLKALCGGEALPSDLAEELLLRSTEVWNMYGPTETTVWSTCTRVISPNEIHIGRPIANTDLYILDPNLQPAPIGVAGELLIGGDGLARGYLNRPESTSEKFIAHPFKPGAKLYRTGDLVKYRSNGSVVCLGRLDSQLKMRGYRIELGEIEAMLSNVPGIKEAVVVLGEEQLIAYYVSESGQPVEPSTCREILRAWLPNYMAPAIYVHLRTIPLTPNGKVDRKALPMAYPGASPASSVYVAPRTNLEQNLVAIWEEILKRRPIGVHDNFFDAGGHSLLAVRLFAKVERELGRRLPLASLFQNPTIAQLASLLETDSKQPTCWDSLVCIRQGGEGLAVFIVHGAGGNILIYRDLARHLTAGVSVYGLQSLGLDGHKRPLGAIEEMAASYVEEITRQQPAGPYVLAGYCMGGKVALEMARLLEQRGQSVAMLAMLDSFNFNVANAASFGRSNKLSNSFQLVSFHALNLFALGPRGMWPYVSEKARLAREATAGWLSWACKNVRARRWAGWVGEVPQEGDFIQSVNDRAGFAYIPRSYSGSATLFKPRRTYSAFKDPHMGWREAIKGHLEVVELDMNPHAMLVEPFVQELAAAINVRLQRLFPKLSQKSAPISPVKDRSLQVP